MGLFMKVSRDATTDQGYWSKNFNANPNRHFKGQPLAIDRFRHLERLFA